MQVSLSLTRCVKFNRLEGGMTVENVEKLLNDSASILARLSSCSRIIRAILPPMQKARS